MYSPNILRHLPSRKRFTTWVIEETNSSEIAKATPRRQSIRCWARNPSRPQDVPRGKLLILSRTIDGDAM
ncbi:hypothetical protein Tco_0495415, partial [Tanacetum coccineum]